MNNYNTPNSNGNIFRNISFIQNRTPVDIKQLQFLIIYDEHNALLGGTNMVDLYWNGTLWHYRDISDFSRKKAVTKQQLDSGVCDAVYLSKNKFVIVEDSGAVQIQELVQMDEQFHFQSLEYACQHEDSVLTISAFPNQKNIVTAGMDCCIKVWDTEDLISSYSYNYAHCNVITGTDVKPMCNSTFISVSLDNESLLWDIRQAKPASCIFKRDNCPLMAVSWNTNLDHLVAIGTANGDIALVDIRQTETPVYESVESDRSIHKLLFNPSPEKKEQLACCSDNTIVKIFNTQKEMLEVYENDSHTDFVRGLAWYKDDLYTCSWDGSVIKHNINIAN